MTAKVFHPEEFHNVIGDARPVLELHSGDVVTTTTIDAHGVDEKGAQVAQEPNPLTGPFAVAEAEPGDSLGVRILQLKPNRSACWTRRYLSPGVLTSELLSRFPELLAGATGEPDYVDWTIDSSGKLIEPTSPAATPSFPPVPLAPMLGCIGVAPPEGQRISTTTSGEYGGNMDYVGVREGATLYFPVFTPGALLYLGDGHATQSHGEIGGTGTEVTMEVTFEVSVLKKRTSAWPRGENATHLFAIGNARPLELALQYATSEMFAWLVDGFRMKSDVASILMGQCVEYAVGNVFDPAFTMVCLLPKRYLPKESEPRPDFD